jgi:hypothetical protein
MQRFTANLFSFSPSAKAGTRLFAPFHNAAVKTCHRPARWVESDTQFELGLTKNRSVRKLRHILSAVAIRWAGSWYGSLPVNPQP